MDSMQSTVQLPDVLENVVLVNLDVHIWSGSTRLNASDIGVDPDSLPPGDLASLGSKKIYPKEDLNAFQTRKKEAIRALEKVGVRFLGGMTFACPESIYDDIVEKLAGIKAQFERLKRELQSAYEHRCREWVAAHPGWEAVIERSLVPIERVMAATSFDFHPFKVREVAPNQPGHLENAGTTLAARMFEEVGKSADDMWRDSLMGKNRVTQRSVGVVRNIRQKLAMLAFVDPRVGPVVQAIDDALDKLPRTGPLEGADFTQLVGLVTFLSDVERMKQHGQRVLDGDLPDDASDVAVAVDTADTEQRAGEGTAAEDEAGSDEGSGDLPGIVKPASAPAPASGWFY